MTKGDLLFERGASFLEELSHRAAAEGGFAAKLAEPLAEDAVFLRKLKPTLVMARLRGEAPTNGHVEAAPAEPPPAPAPKPKNEEKEKKEKKEKKPGSGPNAIVVAAAAFAVGVFIAKVVDWRGHAHPRF
ncbi:MAG: hypothetical protein H0W87_04845 [Actinobacteria bacterium]|nr:hypothetical protein [Actinomycetota bacterium]